MTTPPGSSGVVAALTAELGGRCRVITDGDLLASYRQDMATVVPGGLPAAVVLPRTVADVSAALALATRFEVPVVPRGAGASLAGGAPRGGGHGAATAPAGRGARAAQRPGGGPRGGAQAWSIEKGAMRWTSWPSS